MPTKYLVLAFTFLNLCFVSQSFAGSSCKALFGIRKATTADFLADKVKIVREGRKGFLAHYQAYTDSPVREVFGRIDGPVIKRATSESDTLYVGVHGLSDNLHVLALVTQNLVSMGKTVLRTDLLGHGQSLLNQSWKYSAADERIPLRDQSDIIQSMAYYWMRELGYKKVAFFGHSLGGGIVAKAAVQMDYDRYETGVSVAGLTLIEPYVMDLALYASEESNILSGQISQQAQEIEEKALEQAETSANRGGLMTGYTQLASMTGIFWGAVRHSVKNASAIGASMMQTDFGLPYLIQSVVSSIQKRPWSTTEGLSVEMQADGAVRAMQKVPSVPSLGGRELAYDLRDVYERLKSIRARIFVGNKPNVLAPFGLMQLASRLSGAPILKPLKTDIPHYPILDAESAKIVAEGIAKP